MSADLRALSEDVARLDRERAAALENFNDAMGNNDRASQRARELYWIKNSEFMGAIVRFHDAWRRAHGLSVEPRVPLRAKSLATKGVSRG